MSKAVLPNVLDRSGLPALSDLQSAEWKELFALLEREQGLFLEQEFHFRSPDYVWPRDPLHNWSRLWEYPYVYHHLADRGEPAQSKPLPKVADVGSGVTFFPFALAKRGYDVICVDTDAVCERDLNRAIPRVGHAPGRVSFRLTDGITLPFGSGEVDAVCCVSVLEHVPNCEGMIGEMARILKPHGLLCLTVDLDLRGDFQLGVEPHRRLVRRLTEFFEYKYPEATLHPLNVLNSMNGPFAHRPPAGWKLGRYIFRERILKRILGRKPHADVPFVLTVHGLVMLRR